MQTREILDRLIAFPSVFTAEAYAGVTDYAISLLAPLGVTCHRLEAPGGGRAGLFASTGPAGPGGIMLSAHLDVVPTADNRGAATLLSPQNATAGSTDAAPRT